MKTTLNRTEQQMLILAETRGQDGICDEEVYNDESQALTALASFGLLSPCIFRASGNPSRYVITSAGKAMARELV